MLLEVTKQSRFDVITCKPRYSDVAQ